MNEKQAKYDVQSLVLDRQFQAQVTERAFQIIVHEHLPHCWALQLDLLLAVKFVFDRVRPKEASVIFPNLPLRHPRGDTEVLLKLTGIQSVDEGLEMWVEHLVRKGSVHIGDCDWQTAFWKTPHGYRISRTQAEDENYCDTSKLPDTLLRRSMIDERRKASNEMTETMENVFDKCQLTQDVSDEALKDTIIQKARDLLPRYMEPVPLDFAINNYKNLITTSYGAGTRIGSSNVAFQAIIDAKETFAGGFDSKVKIVIVKGAIPRAHTNILLKARTEAHKIISHHLSEENSERLGSYGVCFAGLPGTGSGEVWRKLGGNSENRFCEYVELPIDSSSYDGSMLQKILLGAVV